ncbi:DUF973 family protein [Sulfurisphaera ohwakuensis]|uniref:DUF973 family protein n=1 Tax=Sulfurisphaera ohwakuensis TaxID=69656 RepID=A0A650CG46_SULOH|nr:DUF973 family protein [Sulfurisphaera ohwakuensis]MBB5255056.1 putative membrane protein [Sulfurisphaera ohwakuensis]QGR16750.1 DUF973 family protein [Sulfurisphaera ohwakuensis]
MSGQTELEGVKSIRSGVLFEIITALLVGIGIIILLTSGVLTAGLSGSAVGAASGIVGTLIGLVVLIIIGVIIGIVGLLRIRSGFNILKAVGRDVGIGGTGVTLLLVGYILMVIGALLAIVFIGIPILFIGAILALIGQILLGIGFYRIGEIYNTGLVKVGGILVVLSIITDLLGFIGYILVYVGLGRVVNNLPITTSAPMQTYYPPTTPIPQPSTQAVQIYQVGQGVLRSDGYAQFTLYTTTQTTIVSASIEGTNLQATYINPIILQAGNNNITAYFGNISNLTPGTTYIINLTINAQGNMMNIKVTIVYQP